MTHFPIVKMTAKMTHSKNGNCMGTYYFPKIFPHLKLQVLSELVSSEVSCVLNLIWAVDKITL